MTTPNSKNQVKTLKTPLKSCIEVPHLEAPEAPFNSEAPFEAPFMTDLKEEQGERKNN